MKVGLRYLRHQESVDSSVSPAAKSHSVQDQLSTHYNISAIELATLLVGQLMLHELYNHLGKSIHLLQKPLVKKINHNLCKTSSVQISSVQYFLR